MGIVDIKTRKVVVSCEFDGLSAEAKQLILHSKLTPREAVFLLNYRALGDNEQIEIEACIAH